MGAPAKPVPGAGVVPATRRVVCASVNSPVGQQVHGRGSAGAPLPVRVPGDTKPRPVSAAGLQRAHARTAGHPHRLAERGRAPGSRRPSDAGPSASGERGRGRTESPALASKGVPSRGTFADAGRRTVRPECGRRVSATQRAGAGHHVRSASSTAGGRFSGSSVSSPSEVSLAAPGWASARPRARGSAPPASAQLWPQAAGRAGSCGAVRSRWGPARGRGRMGSPRAGRVLVSRPRARAGTADGLGLPKGAPGRGRGWAGPPAFREARPRPPHALTP